MVDTRAKRPRGHVFDSRRSLGSSLVYIEEEVELSWRGNACCTSKNCISSFG